MTGPHPQAVGTYGWDFIAWAEKHYGSRLRWWQRLAAVRLLEHDAEGALVWLVALLSVARQVGKSWLLRDLLLWRIHQAPLFAEEQLCIHTGKDVAVCREVQRPARAWARRRAGEGYRVREVNGQEEVSAPDGSRWLVRAQSSVYGYSASVAVVDEAWKVRPDAVDDGLEPTMVERTSPQLLLVSTAHRRATALMLTRRADALSQLDEPEDVLIMEWSAVRGDALEDRGAWRAASPHWSARRERLLESKLRRAQSGQSDDPDEDDPLEAFRAQYLNVWPVSRLTTAKDEALVDGGAWAAAGDYSEAPPAGALVLAVEDWFGLGAASAACGQLADGRLMVWGALHATRAEALAWCAVVARGREGSRLLVGASMHGDPACDDVQASAVVPVGVTQTRSALALWRSLMADGRLVHDSGDALTSQVNGCRVVRTTTGLSLSARSARSDLMRAAAWAVQETANTPAAPGWFVY